MPKNNISASDFKRTVNAGHETNALAVANKQVDVATNNTENLDKLKTSAPEKLKELKVIWKSPLITAIRSSGAKIFPKPLKTRSTTSL